MYVSVKGKKEYEGAKEKNFRFKIQLGFVSGVASTENFRSKGARASLLSLSSRRRRVRVKKGARTKSERERERVFSLSKAVSPLRRRRRREGEKAFCFG